MTDIYLNIAEITFKLTGNFHDYFIYRVRNYRCDKVEHPDVSISYKEEDKIFLPELREVKKDFFTVIAENNENYIKYDTLNDETVTALSVINKNLNRVECSLYDVEDLGGASLSIRNFNVIGEIVRNIAIGFNALTIHSSALSYNNNGVIFSANAGTGKSTHTRLWQETFDGVEIINDDMPIIRKTYGRWKLCGAPWSGKSEININKSVPLKAIVFLERGEKNEIEKINPPESIFKILSQTTLPAYKDMTKMVMDNISMLISDIPVYRLKCNISREAPLTVAKELGLI